MQARLDLRDKAATNIQRMIRGWLARIHVFKMKETIQTQFEKVWNRLH